MQFPLKIKVILLLLLGFMNLNPYGFVIVHQQRVRTLSGLSVATAATPNDETVNTEPAWRYVKKPLLRIGSKGIGASHGNSLRELLDAHTAVKIKINTDKLGSLQAVFETLRDFAESAGAKQGIELLQSRDSEKTILVGAAGTIDKIDKGEFPPPPPPPREQQQDIE